MITGQEGELLLPDRSHRIRHERQVGRQGDKSGEDCHEAYSIAKK
jgi:hypothetical protein